MFRIRHHHPNSEVKHEKATHRSCCQMLRMRASANGASRPGGMHGPEVHMRWVLPAGTDAERGNLPREAVMTGAPLIKRADFRVVDGIRGPGSTCR